MGDGEKTPSYSRRSEVATSARIVDRRRAVASRETEGRPRGGWEGRGPTEARDRERKLLRPPGSG